MYCGAPVKEDTTDPTLPSGTENEEPSSEAAGSSNKKKKGNVKNKVKEAFNKTKQELDDE